MATRDLQAQAFSTVIEPNFDGGLIHNDWIKGTIFIKITRAQRNAIGPLFRSLQNDNTTACLVIEDGVIYKLINNPTTQDTTDSDWAPAISVANADTQIIPIGTWDITNTNPVLQDTDANGINGNFYYVQGAPNLTDVTIPGLFQNTTTQVINKDWILSVGTHFVALSNTTTWDNLNRPQSIIDYENGTVIGHTHTLSEVIGLISALAEKYDENDLADMVLDFADVPDSSIGNVAFLRKHFYDKSFVYSKDEVDILLSNKVHNEIPGRDVAGAHPANTISFTPETPSNWEEQPTEVEKGLNLLAEKYINGGSGIPEAPIDGNQYADTAGVVSVPFTHMTTNISQKVLDAQYDFQPIATGAQDGFGAKVSLIADGDSQHVPTFTGFEAWPNTDMWDNTAGVKNEIIFYLWGSTYYYNITNGTETVIDTPPAASSVSIIGSLVAGNQLTGNYTYNDDDGDPESGTTFQWYRADDQSGTNKAAISGATSQNFTLQAADEGKHIQFGVTPANANSTGAEALSAWSTVVEASDTTAPTFSNVSVDNLSDTTADFNAQINEAGTIFWAAFPTATAQQTKAVIEAGTGAVDFGSVATPGSTIETDGITGLSASTDYKIHYFGRDSSSNESDPAITSEFSTTSGDVTAPTITGIAVNGDNTEVVVSFSEACYANDDGTGDLQVADFTAGLSGGTATSPVLSNPVHTAGDSSITFDLSYTGTADFNETLTITVVDNSVYDLAGNVMASGQNGTDVLNAPWAPSDLGADLLLWLDASDVSTVTVDGSNNVTGLADKTANNNDFDGTGHEPLYDGSSKITFDSSNSEYLTLSDLTDFANNNAGTIAIKIRKTIDANNTRGFVVNTSSIYSSYISVDVDDSGSGGLSRFLANANIPKNLIQSATPPGTTSANIIISSDGSSYISWFNGVKVTGVTSGTDNGTWINDFTVGRTSIDIGKLDISGGPYYGDMEFFRLLYVNRQITDQEASDINTWLNA
jgi:hypothetical protein